MPADDSQPISVTEGVNYPRTQTPRSSPTIARSPPFSHFPEKGFFCHTHTHTVIADIATHPKSCQAVCLISIESERLHEQGDSFIKS